LLINAIFLAVESVLLTKIQDQQQELKECYELIDYYSSKYENQETESMHESLKQSSDHQDDSLIAGENKSTEDVKEWSHSQLADKVETLEIELYDAAVMNVAKDGKIQKLLRRIEELEKVCFFYFIQTLPSRYSRPFGFFIRVSIECWIGYG
jgi:hypothetical protein